jgi:hypothetical protein
VNAKTKSAPCVVDAVADRGASVSDAGYKGLSLERGSKRQLLGDTAKSRGRAIAAKRKSNDLGL